MSKYDVPKAQKLRNEGMKPADIAKKLGIPSWVIYQQTDPPTGKTAKLARPAKVKPAQTNFASGVARSKNSDGPYAAILADLIAQRDKITKVIEALQELT